MIRKVYLAFLLISISLLCVAQQPKQQWVDSVFSSLTLDQQLGQLFIFPANGHGNEDHLNVIKNTIDRYTLGGLIIVDGNPSNTIRLLNSLKSHADLPLLSMIKITHGLGTSLKDVDDFPTPLTIGACADKKIIFDLGSELGNQLDLLGINVGLYQGFSSSGTVFKYETWGENADSISQKMHAFLNGFQKHNSQIGIANFTSLAGKYSKKEIEYSFKGYQTAIDKGLNFISIDHNTSAMDQKTPAFLSKNVIDYLRKNLSFKGFIIAEELESLREYRPGKTEAQAILTGNDLIVSSNIANSIKRIKKLIRKGDIELLEIQKKVKKILTYKFDLIAEEKGIKVEDNINLKINNQNTKTLYHKTLKSSTTVINNNEQLPIKYLSEKNFASLTSDNGKSFTKALDDYALFSHFDLSGSVEKLISFLSLYDKVIVGVFDEDNVAVISRIIESIDGSKLIVCAPAHSLIFKRLPSNVALITGFDDSEDMMKIYPQAIFGAGGFNGKLPISLSGNLKANSGSKIPSLDRLGFGIPEEVGMSSKFLSEIDKIVYAAIEDQATPGAQVVVARKGKVVFQKSYGYYTYDNITPVTDNTIYDIASITKVAATTQAIMFLHEHNMIDLDKKIGHYLPELKGSNKEFMTIRDILTHQAGLWPFLPFWKETLLGDTYASVYFRFSPDDDYPYQISDGLYTNNITRDSVWNWVVKSKLRPKEAHKPYDYKYSDMGYYILQKLTEKLVNQPLEEFLQQNFYDPLGLNTMSYLPLCKFPISIIAPTEYDNYFRKTLVNGMVHDQGAALMGGVAGHAGLFSNALDLAKLMQMNLQKGKYGGLEYFMEGTVQYFTDVQYESNRRGLGWDKPVVGEWNSPTSTYASKKSFGHTGFTGTAAWIDPEFDLIYVFLSNRIYPDATNTKLIKNNIRTRIQDLIYQSIWEYSAIHSDTCN